MVSWAVVNSDSFFQKGIADKLEKVRIACAVVSYWVGDNFLPHKTTYEFNFFVRVNTNERDNEQIRLIDVFVIFCFFDGKWQAFALASTAEVWKICPDISIIVLWPEQMTSKI